LPREFLLIKSSIMKSPTPCPPVRLARIWLIALIGTICGSFALPAYSENLTAQFDARHEACLEAIADDADTAYENAMIWRDEGGGRRARHCEAMALFAVGHKEEAAFRLSKLAKSPDGGTEDMRADFYAESANFWLIANNPLEAYTAATAGLDIKETHLDLRISRARAYALLGRYDYAEIDLSSVITLDPTHASALRYRADARRNQGKLKAAKSDIEKALLADPTSVETAIVRGEINEAIRLKALK